MAWQTTNNCPLKMRVLALLFHCSVRVSMSPEIKKIFNSKYQPTRNQTQVVNRWLGHAKTHTVEEVWGLLINLSIAEFVLSWTWAMNWNALQLRKRKWKLLSGVRHFSDPMDYTIHGILRWIPAWVAISFSRGFSQPRDQTQVSCIAGGFFISWATREAQECCSG